MAQSTNRTWIWGAVAVGAVALAVACFFIGRATAPEEPIVIPPGLSKIVILTEATNGQAVRVSPGAVLVLQLPGNPTTGYTWNITPPDPAVVRVDSGPVFTPTRNDEGSPGVLTFTGMAVALGTTEIDGRYVSPSGVEEKTYKVIIEVIKSAPTTSTLPPSTTSPVTPPSTSASTTTSDSTTTTGASTTTSGSTTTTKPPTTTTTTAPPTTTTLAPTTTSSLPKPTTTTLPNVFYIDWTQDGKLLTIPVDTEKVVVTLPANPSTGHSWMLSQYEPQVIKPIGEPVFTPQEGQGQPGTPGYMVWTFELVGLGSTPLEFKLSDPANKPVDLFFVGLQTLVQPK